MKWTTERPTGIGIYWIRGVRPWDWTGTLQLLPTRGVVTICEILPHPTAPDAGNEPHRVRFFGAGGRWAWQHPSFVHAEWAGPLKGPE